MHRVGLGQVPCMNGAFAVAGHLVGCGGGAEFSLLQRWSEGGLRGTGKTCGGSSYVAEAGSGPWPSALQEERFFFTVTKYLARLVTGEFSPLETVRSRIVRHLMGFDQVPFKKGFTFAWHLASLS